MDRMEAQDDPNKKDEGQEENLNTKQKIIGVSAGKVRTPLKNKRGKSEQIWSTVVCHPEVHGRRTRMAKGTAETL